jgi:hypothetical protein
MEPQERRALVRATASYVRKCIAAKAEADAATIASLTTQLKEMRSEIDRVRQLLSSVQKHCAALERKIGAKA